MMARRWCQGQLDASAVFHALQKSEWVGMAEELAELSDEDFEQVLLAFRVYRRADRDQLASLSPKRQEKLPKSRKQIRSVG
ncbi:hypothetical protein GF380_04960 [Candidatus Uhrbacteria bacterium]|nr:hypothetical protein [Candidatus Uhrbacteria bacterium]MBD3284382.1 hypothetical protein [Candidatus Uhrbacteria bacterium]